MTLRGPEVTGESVRVITIGVKLMVGMVGGSTPRSLILRPALRREALAYVASGDPVSGMRERKTLCSLRVRNKQHLVPQEHDGAFLVTFPQEHGL